MIASLWKEEKAVLDKNGDNVLSYILLTGSNNNPVAIERSKHVISTINDSGIKTEQLARINDNWLKELTENSIEALGIMKMAKAYKFKIYYLLDILISIEFMKKMQ